MTRRFLCAAKCEIRNMKSDNILDELCSRLNVFSWAQPEDKIAIVHTWQPNGFVCGMTGDGVNDAAALTATSASLWELLEQMSPKVACVGLSCSDVVQVLSPCNSPWPPLPLASCDYPLRVRH